MNKPQANSVADQHKDSRDDARPPAGGADEQPLPPEVGGRDGPDPTRYGDWEKAGRCIDF